MKDVGKGVQGVKNNEVRYRCVGLCFPVLAECALTNFR